jgi:hypothetical protein
LLVVSAGMAGGAAVELAGLKIVKSATVDLNGDGKSEKVSITILKRIPREPGERDYLLRVDGASVSAYMECVEGFAVVDVDVRDHYKEIAVYTGPSDDNWFVFYSYDGKSLKKMGEAEWPTLKGNGIVYDRHRMAFTTVTDKYALNYRTRTLELVPQEMYYIGRPITITKSFAVYQSRTSKEVLANLEPRSKAQILAYSPAPAKPSADSDRGRAEYERMMDGWYLIKTQSNLLGWARLRSFNGKVEGIYWAD